MIEAYVWRTDSETYAQAMEQNGQLNTGMKLNTNRRSGTSAQRTVGGGRTSGLGVMGGTGGPESGPQVFRILDWRMLR